jgi:hypothetical protein
VVVECERFARYTPCDGSVSAPDGIKTRTAERRARAQPW